MKLVEYGSENKTVLVLLHGGGLSWWNYRREAELLGERYRVLLPILDGHSGSDRPFTTIEDNARELIGYIDRCCGGSVELIGGLSLGAQVLVETLSQRGGICRWAVVESALAIPMKLTHSLVKSTVDMSYGLIERPWFSKLQFKQLNISPELYGDYYRDSCNVSRADMIAFLRANLSYRLKDSLGDTGAKTLVLVGSREQKRMLDSARLIHGAVKDSRLCILPGYTHGELSLNHARDYAALLEKHMMECKGQ